MTETPKHPIVAVFGSTDSVGESAATLIGRQLRAQECVLLTGGERGEGRGVKEFAIAGFKAAKGSVPRVGVPSAEKGKVEVDDLGNSSILLRQPFADRRNYLEAWMCDVAVAIYGGAGTASEVAFCIARQRPVVLVGRNWEQEYPIARSEQERKSFLTRAQCRVPAVRKPKWPGVPDLDELIADAYRDLPTMDTRREHRPHPETDGDAQAIVAMAMSLANDAVRTDPPLPAVAELAGIVDRYGEWRDVERG